MAESESASDIIAKFDTLFTQASPFLKTEGLGRVGVTYQTPPRLAKEAGFDQQWQAVLDDRGSYIDDQGRRVSVKRHYSPTSLSEDNHVEWAAYNAAKMFLILTTWCVRDHNRNEPASIIWRQNLDIMQHASEEEIKDLLVTELIRMRNQADTRATITLTPNPYSYPALPVAPSAIRLVVLLPSTQRYSDIVCKLCNGILGRSKYEALSYVWGDASRTKSITVNDRQFKVTENLEAALRNIRCHDKYRVLWIDSICIDQNDVKERNSQVQRMDLIYNSSQRVIVWLGPESEDSSNMLNLLSTFNKSAEENDEIFKKPSSYQRSLEIARAIEQVYGSGYKGILNLEAQRGDPKPMYTQLNHLLKRPWFRRVWCIQEFILGRHVLFQCGQSILASEDFESSIVSLNKIVTVLPEFPRHKNHSDGFNRVYLESRHSTTTIGRFLSWKTKYQSDSISVLGLLSAFSEWEASDPRDKVFGLYGIVPQKNQDRDALKPDYTLNTAEVYNNVAVYFLRKYRNLDILSIATHPPKGFPRMSLYRLLPSWIPDWRDGSRFGINSLCRPIAFYRSDDNTTYFDSIYNASLGLEATPINLIDHSQVLVLNGINVDTIEVIGNWHAGNYGSRDHSLKILSEWQEIVDLSKERCYRFSGQPIREAWWRIVLGDILEDTGTDKRRDETGFRNRIPLQDVKLHWLLSFPPSAKDDDEAMKEAKFQNRLMCCRRFFRTAKGLLGLAPMWAREGDHVAVLFGGRVPFILRRYYRWYHVVGESYVHGIMDGEVIPQLRIKEFQDLKVEQFHLA